MHKTFNKKGSSFEHQVARTSQIPLPQKQVLGILKAYLKESKRIQKMEAHEKCSRIKLVLHYNSIIIWDLR